MKWDVTFADVGLLFLINLQFLCILLLRDRTVKLEYKVKYLRAVITLLLDGDSLEEETETTQRSGKST